MYITHTPIRVLNLGPTLSPNLTPIVIKQYWTKKMHGIKNEVSSGIKSSFPWCFKYEAKYWFKFDHVYNEPFIYRKIKINYKIFTKCKQNAPIKEKINDISSYEVIYIMSPIYWGTYAPELETAIKNLDFNGKIVRIITTHEGSGLANVVSDVKKICKGANVLDDAIAIKGTEAKNSKSRIESWI